MTKMTWQYLAGFFDGEGHVGIHANRARRGNGMPVVSIGQSGERGRVLIVEIAEFLRAHDVKCYFGHKRAYDNVQAQHILRVANRAHVVTFLRGVFPYLRIKKVEAQDVLRFLTIFGSIKGWYFRELNRLRSEARARGEGYVAIAVPYNSPESLCKEGRARVKYLRTHNPKWR